ncbi:MAG: hypothetical protein RIB61_06275 [Roseicyclus sp.]
MKPTLFLARSAVALTLSSLTVGSALADDGVTPLGNCYNTIMDICNAEDDVEGCAVAGMDACDETYGDSTSPGGVLERIRILVGPDRGGNTRYRVILETDRTEPGRPGTHDGDDGTSSEPNRDPDRGDDDRQPQQGN